LFSKCIEIPPLLIILIIILIIIIIIIRIIARGFFCQLSTYNA